MKSNLLGLRLFLGYNEYDNNYLFEDMEVNECIMKMYFYLLSGEEEYYKEFEVLYNKLSKKQKEIVKDDYNYIMDARSKKILSLKKK